jgi:hypothetical protein
MAPEKFTRADSMSSEPASGGECKSPGLPGFRSWRGVYRFVLGAYVLYVVLLAVWTRWFS